jgi:hypothetical protein
MAALWRLPATLARRSVVPHRVALPAVRRAMSSDALAKKGPVDDSVGTETVRQVDPDSMTTFSPRSSAPRSLRECLVGA